jgi:TPR repeat protein
MIQHAFGFMYMAGVGGLQRDFKKAEEFYKKAIKIDNYPNSLYNLGLLYYNGLGSEAGDKSKILELFEKSAKAGYPLAQFQLGDIYHFGRANFSEDYGKAYYWYQQASNQGHPKAARRIGWMYDRAEGFKRDVEKAFYWHKLAAQRGNKHSKGDMMRLKSELYKRNKNR